MENPQIQQIKAKIERLTLQLEYLQKIEELKRKQSESESKESKRD